jgi:2-polyprenyl-3-methyl-5-hydroxy-6-metoxy-1,4-benzoquinol methylase
MDGVHISEMVGGVTQMTNLRECNFCGSTGLSMKYSLRDTGSHPPVSYLLKKCINCGLLLIDPQPGEAELINAYPVEYHAYVRKTLTPLQKYGVKRRIKKVLLHMKNGKSLLDIGCATGQFLHEFNLATDWSVTGLEPIPTAADFARETWGLKVISAPFSRTRFGESRFDVVTMWDVLEHMRDPSAILKDIYALLNPGGCFVLKIPDPSSAEARIFKENWVGFEVPQHLYAFQNELIISKLKEIGFSIVIVNSLAKWLVDKGSIHIADMLKIWIKNSIGRFIAAVLILPFRFISGSASRLYFAYKPVNDKIR